MADFIAEVIGQDKTEEGNVVTIRMTGFGSAEGPLMTRAKARAIATSSFGSDTAEMERVTDVPGEWKDIREHIFADKSEGLFTGPVSGIRDRLQAFRSEGLFAEVKNVKELKTERVLSDDKLEDTFGNLSGVVSTYEYEILVTTKYSFS